MIEPHHQPLAHAPKIRDGIEGLALAALGPLAVAGVNERNLVRLAGDGRGDARVHAAAEQNHGLGGRPQSLRALF